MSVIGIDYSYTSPSICILGENFEKSEFYFMNSVKKVCVKALNYDGTHLKKTDFNHEVQRYDHVSDWALGVIANYYKPGETKIFLEGFSFGSSVGLVFNIAENGGLLKYKLFKQLNVIPTLFAPTSVKKFYTGKGNAAKDAMVETLKETEGISITKWLNMDSLRSPAHDIVDSYAIAKFGLSTTK